MRLFRRRDNELDAEIEANLRMAEQDRVERGETRDEARRNARREFGNEAPIKEVTREMWGWRAFYGMARDFRYGARMLRKNPGFAAVVVLTLALGIGANTAIYSTMRAALTPAPIPAMDRAVMVWSENASRDEHQFPVSAPDYRDWKAGGVFSYLSAFEEAGRNLRLGGRSERVDGIDVTGGFFTALFFPDRPEPRPEDVPLVLRNRVAGDYFRAMRIPLLRRRYLNEGDRKDAPLVALIDQWTARRYWPNQDPVGRPFKFGRKEPARNVVGVVGDVDSGVAVTLLKGRMGHFYIPAGQEPRAEMTLVARTEGDPLQLVSPMREVVRGIDIDQPVFDVMTLATVRAAGSESQELASLLLGGFAAVALLLAAIGIYGVAAYNVGRRTREFGIRMSLGAQPGDVLRLAIRRGILLTAAGIALGLAGAFGLTRVMRDLLYGIGATDPATFAAVTAVLAAVTLLAGYLPARRATRVDPVLALREE